MSKYLVLVGQAKAKIEAANALLEEFEGKVMPDEKGADFDRLMKEAEGLKAQAERYKLLDERDAELKTAEKNAPAEPPKNNAAIGSGNADDNQSPAFQAVYQMRFGSDGDAKTAVMGDLVGKSYQQTIWDQNAAYANYLRNGEKMLSGDEIRLLKTQVFPWQQVEYLLKAGLSVGEIKTTMVEAQGTLGGYAVPPNVQQEIATRLPGLTAVRQGGARVIQLINGNSTDVPLYTGGTERYRGNLRGAWGNETKNPDEKNATVGTVPVPAHVYTFKVPMSQSLVEDAANLIDLVTSDIVDTGAIDEDEAFLIGDGVGRPLGIMPSAGNGLSLTEVTSGHATTLTADGVKRLKRGIATQYRRNAKWIGNSDTYSAIENLKDGAGAYIFPDLSDDEMLLKRQALESEAMADVAANAFPLLFMDLSGYWIVEKFGWTIVRFQDSNTGINKVEYHVRRRVGGRFVQIWKGAVQKVAA